MADTLSRLPQYNSVKAEVVWPAIPSKQLTSPVTIRSQGRKESEISNELCKKLKEALILDEWLTAHKNDCTMHDGLAWVGAKLYVPLSLRSTVLHGSHDSKSAGHFSFVKTLQLIKQQFWWRCLKKDIKSYMASCPVCAVAKRLLGKPTGLLQSMASCISGIEGSKLSNPQRLPRPARCI